ncbi:MAG: DUF2027 domain-containing protein [Odoribacter sp.]|nr:DUF2027 domain-containing protein [Odoribacter sp.]
MNIRIGDIVRFLSERMEGKVTGITDQNTVQVYINEYGFEIPASIQDLVVIRTDTGKPDSDTLTNTNRPQNQKSVTTESTDMVYLAIVPDNFKNLTDSRYELFIVNDTDRTCLYSVAFRNNNNNTYTGILAGNCTPDGTSAIGSYSLKEIDTSIKAIHIQAIFFQKGSTRLKSAIDTEVKINPVNLCKAGNYKHTRWFEPVTTLRPLDKEHSDMTEDMDAKQFMDAAAEKKASENSPVQRPQKRTNGNMIEIDLHSNELLETTAGMDNKDILEYQLDFFRKTMEENKLRKGQKIVFIHGKGEGILRQRIIWELQTKYKRHHHQDASFKQYGFGATLVTIK